MMFDARGPKCLVTISIHINESQEISIPASSAIKSSCRSVLFARRFMHMTLIEKSETTVEGIDRSNIFVSIKRSFIVYLLSPYANKKCTHGCNQSKIFLFARNFVLGQVSYKLSLCGTILRRVFILSPCDQNVNRQNK